MMNEDIRFKEVRCNAEDGTSYGIISSAQALALADEAGLDLVCIAPSANPPVVKIMNYGKFKYQQEKKQKEAKKNQKIIVTKEIKLSVKIALNDIEYKVKHALEFFEKGYHVRFRVFLKGREMSNPEAGAEVLARVWEMIKDHAVLEAPAKLEGRYVNMLVVPSKKSSK
ncbi:MAG: translation initiation factor IF-3 [Campylobacterales bacterium]|nr:translation initiation factor IF-3 [Campylobacterales bacterium]